MKKQKKYYQISLNKASKDNVRAIKILETS